MGRILILLLIFPFATPAQDSLSFGTETVAVFKRQSLMDEFDRAFASDKKVNFRIRAGLTDFPNSRYSPILPFIFVEQRIGHNFSVGVGGVFSTRENAFPKMGQPLSPADDLNIAVNAELRYYLKSNTKLSGNYLGLEFKKSREPSFLAHGMMPSFIARPYYLKSQFSLNAGKQFGSVMDIGLQAGVKNILKPEVYKSGFVNTSKDYGVSPAPFLGMYSRLSLGLDFPLNKSKQQAVCEFLNCYSEFNQLFKVNLSNLFYLDPYHQNLKLDVGYERKLGQLPLSVNLDAVAILNNERNYKPVKREPGPDEPLFAYESRRSSQTLFTISSTLQMRYYFLQKRAVVRGKAVNNLSGVYSGLFYTRHLKMDDPNKMIRVTWNSEKVELPSYASGLMLGMQRKILKNYYYDFGIRYNAAGRNIPPYQRFSQDIKFGYTF